MNGVLWFAKRVVFGPHFCDVRCVKLSKKFDQKNDLISESDCLYLKDAMVKHVTSFDMNFASYSNEVLLEFQQHYDSSVKDLSKFKFKKFFLEAKAPSRATKGSVVYDFYSVEEVVIFPQACKAVATYITLLPPPGVYSTVASRSNVALKNTDLGGGVIDLDYRGDAKIAMMNHSTDFDLNIEVGDKSAQFILTRFESPDVVEVSELDSATRSSVGFGSTGQ